MWNTGVSNTMSSHPKTAHKAKVVVKPIVHDTKPVKSAPVAVSKPHTQKTDKAQHDIKPVDRHAKPVQKPNGENTENGRFYRQCKAHHPSS